MLAWIEDKIPRVKIKQTVSVVIEARSGRKKKIMIAATTEIEARTAIIVHEQIFAFFLPVESSIL